MDSAVLLDLLGNENRRRILRLLSHKPCYVTEISEYLGVSPKAVIDHLRKLEDAGLIESHTDDRRRKYFHIARDVRLEVNVSRHGFGTKSAYPANPSLDIQGRCPHMHIDLELRSAGDNGDNEDNGESGGDNDRDGDATTGDGDRGGDDSRGDLAQLAAEFDELQDLENELSLAQRWVHGRMSELLDRVNDRLGVDADSRFYAKLLAAVTSTDGSHRAVVEEVDADPQAVEDGLQRLADADLLARESGRWRLAG
ncbi:ArsR/SmtB family transcription factor [Halobaculum magnesiiphilum]|uniref:ArsR family transcriptional regulator n=1 Tax=Halobaculum magnesiiphilum TaxID=1017351 RepID=A0A8T8WCF2_9EURY|nr:ArsR family transcriptional regulator [Halobaculum magnesiiphilum]QZP37433.1 ArsR family transcriptional regulator [Halobaculum magnesiiphilum]